MSDLSADHSDLCGISERCFEGEGGMTGKLYKCDICGTVAPWGETWLYWGSIRLLEEWGIKGVVVYCSSACRENSNPAMILKARGIKL